MRIYKRGKTYWCEFELDKKRYQYSCKTKDKDVAEEVASAIHADAIRNRFNIPAKNKAERFFGEVWQEYYKSLVNEPATLISKNDAAKHLLPVFENKNIAGISQTDIENYRLKRKLEILSMRKNVGKKESEINFRTVNLEISTLHHFFNYCIKHTYIDKNSSSGIKRLNELSRIKTLSDSDIQKLIAGATNKLTKDLITFLIYTGCRKGEVLNLKWDDMDLQNDVIAIKGTKTKYDRYIPISKPLKELLRGINKNQGLYVFNRNGAKIANFRKSFMTACRNAGLKDLRIHDLRHVFASKMVMNGTSLYITGELLGHQTTQMTKRYF